MSRLGSSRFNPETELKRLEDEVGAGRYVTLKPSPSGRNGLERVMCCLNPSEG
jgi:hypothetical protein